MVQPNVNALCQRMANEVHRDVLPGDSHMTAMEAIRRVGFEDECHNDPWPTESTVLSSDM